LGLKPTISSLRLCASAANPSRVDAAVDQRTSTQPAWHALTLREVALPPPSTVPILTSTF
jgi:hypothetical protein